MSDSEIKRPGRYRKSTDPDREQTRCDDAYAASGRAAGAILGAGAQCSSNCGAETDYAIPWHATVPVQVNVPADKGFGAVLLALTAGQGATRAAWRAQLGVTVRVGFQNSEGALCSYLYMEKQHLGRLNPRESWSPSLEDLFATDWAILPE